MYNFHSIANIRPNYITQTLIDRELRQCKHMVIKYTPYASGTPWIEDCRCENCKKIGHDKCKCCKK